MNFAIFSRNFLTIFTTEITIFLIKSPTSSVDAVMILYIDLICIFIIIEMFLCAILT